MQGIGGKNGGGIRIFRHFVSFSDDAGAFLLERDAFSFAVLAFSEERDAFSFDVLTFSEEHLAFLLDFLAFTDDVGAFNPHCSPIHFKC
jgi:hypothetical protein